MITSYLCEYVITSWRTTLSPSIASKFNLDIGSAARFFFRPLSGMVCRLPVRCFLFCIRQVWRIGNAAFHSIHSVRIECGQSALPTSALVVLCSASPLSNNSPCGVLCPRLLGVKRRQIHLVAYIANVYISTLL